mmetsp:Transcript_12742/g.53929  ORF Transcript_12742/g.53929 Transcript_12742/m.53929 type:complete len:90 (+) Transcript_12742:1074-1343(+)
MGSGKHIKRAYVSIFATLNNAHLVKKAFEVITIPVSIELRDRIHFTFLRGIVVNYEDFLDWKVDRRQVLYKKIESDHGKYNHGLDGASG